LDFIELQLSKTALLTQFISELDNTAMNDRFSNINRLTVTSCELPTHSGPFDIVVSGFAIHHQPDKRKREIYTEVFSMLAPGGIFLNLEHVASATDAGQELFDDFFVDHLYAFHSRSDAGANRDAIADEFYKRPDKKENILAPVQNQCKWLRQIGFADVDCFFKVFELALFGGRKISNKANSADAKSRAAD